MATVFSSCSIPTSRKTGAALPATLESCTPALVATFPLRLADQPVTLSPSSGLSFLAIGFDTFFAVQHFVLYRHSTVTLFSSDVQSEQRGPEEDERSPLLGDGGGDEERA